MRPYIVRLTPHEPNTFLVPNFIFEVRSNKEPTVERITADQFRSATMDQFIVHRLFNGEHNDGGGFYLNMSRLGPVLNLIESVEPFELDGERIYKDVETGITHNIPLGLPAKQHLKITHHTFDHTVEYAE